MSLSIPSPCRDHRVLAIGLDAADWQLLQQWVHKGHLPVMASLMQRGCWRELRSTADMGSGTVWPSFFTGASPAKHGGISSRSLKAGSYQVRYERADLVRREPFWTSMGRHGKRVVVLDVPKVRPIPGLCGIQLAGWGAHSPGWYCDAWPTQVKQEVLARFGTFPVPDDDRFIPTGYHQLQQFYQALLSGIDRKKQLSLHYLRQEEWDLFITVFAEPHCVGHNFWHLMDEHHPAHDVNAARTLGDAILNVYACIDAAVAELMAAAPDATIVLFSPEGMGPNYTGSFLLPEVLRRLGMGSNREKGGIDHLHRLSPSRRWGPHAIRNLRSVLPQPLLTGIEQAKRVVPEQTWQRWKAWLMTVGNDWQWHRAFCFPSDFNGAIRINVKGREPNGQVAPGSEYDAVCDTLIGALGELINVDTGKKAVAEVMRVDRLHTGPYLNELPDLVVRWKGDAPIRGLMSARIGSVRGTNRHERSGAHRPYGFLIAAGAPIAQKGRLETAHLTDIAPTLLRLLDQPIPQDIDGCVKTDMMAKG